MGPMEPSFDRPKGQFQDVGNLVVGKLLLVSELDHDPIVGREIPNQIGQFFPPKALVEAFVRAWLIVDEVERWSIIPIRISINRRRLQAFLAKKVDRLITRDLVEPGGEVALQIELFEGPEGLDEGLLGQIAGILITRDHAMNQDVDRPVESLDQKSKRLFFPFETPSDDFRIGHRHRATFEKVRRLDALERSCTVAPTRPPCLEFRSQCGNRLLWKALPADSAEYGSVPQLVNPRADVRKTTSKSCLLDAQQLAFRSRASVRTTLTIASRRDEPK